MAIFLRIFSLCLVCCLSLIITPLAVLADPSVELLRVAEGGLQPEVLLDAHGVLATYLLAETQHTDQYADCKESCHWSSSFR